jgi:hypothetical protein
MSEAILAEQLNPAFETWPSYRFLQAVESEWKTPNGSDFFIYRDDPISPEGGFVAGCVTLDCIANTYLHEDVVKKYVVHIAMIGVTEQFRGCGFLAYICGRLIYWADECGVFLFGHARAFEYPMPVMHSAEDVLAWLPGRDKATSHKISLKRDLADSRRLHGKYLEYGFSRFDGTGVRFGNRKWKRLCFGHCGAGMENRTILDFSSSHLSAC